MENTLYHGQDDQLSIDLRKFFLACEISSCVKHEDRIEYKVAPRYLKTSVAHANRQIKAAGLNLIAEATAADQFTVKQPNEQLS